MLARTDWEHLIPHAGTMCLLDAVLAWDDTTLHAVSGGHARADQPLRGPAGLHAVHLAEYGAQATAVHGALRARAAGAGPARPGMLVSLRDVQLAVTYVDPDAGNLHVHVQCLYADDAGAQYLFRVAQADASLATGRVAVIHPDVQPSGA